MKKKVLIISYSYPPSNVPAAQRPYAVAKYLNKDEFDVTVITCANPDSSLGYNNDFDASLDGVHLLKVKGYFGNKASKFRDAKMVGKKSPISKLKGMVFTFLSSIIIPDKGIFWYPKIKRFLLDNKELMTGADIVFTTSPSFTNHLIGAFIKRKCKSNVFWLAELRDFHALETNMNNLKVRINKYLEKKIVRESDKVSFISHSMTKIYSAHYSKNLHKFITVYNGFDLSDFMDLPVCKTNNQKLTIFYAGSFYKGVRSPLPLLQVLDALIERRMISLEEVEIHIAGNFEAEMISEASNYQSFKIVRFLGKIPRSEVLSRMVKADLLWLIVGDKTTHYTGVPIKLFEYIASRRPVINFAPSQSEPTTIIEKYNLGWNFATNPFTISDAIPKFEAIIHDFKSGSLVDPLPQKNLREFDRRHQGVLFGKIFSDSKEDEEMINK